MRIGIFTETYPPFINGVSTSILMLQKALEKKGHTVFIITVNQNKIKYEYDEENRILRLPSAPLPVYDYRFTSVYPVKAIKKIKEMNLDVIHTHIELTVGMFARIVSKQLGIPLVHTYHTKWEDYTHYVTHGNPILELPSKELVKYLSVLMADKTTTELIVPTRKIYNLLHEKYNITKNIHIVPTGIDVERFDKNTVDKKIVNDLKKYFKIKNKDFVIVSISRLAKEKSLDKLIINHKDVVKRNKDVKLLIVGDGPDREILENLVKQLKLEKNVIFTGKVPLESIQYYYRLGDVFATFSTTETQGLTVCEAAASSLPILAIKDDSYIDAVVNNLNGYLFTSDQEYIDDVFKLLKDKKMYEKFSNQSKIISESMSSDVFAERVLIVYNSAITNYKNKNIFSKIKDKIEGNIVSWKK